MSNRTISLVVSAYNEEGNIDALHAALCDVLAELPITAEIIFVNDGSTDATLTHCQEIQKKDERVRIYNLTKNFGHEIAMTAGMDFASGDAVIFLDADLQHPPRYITTMVEEWLKGADIVLTRRTDNESTSLLYKVMAKCFYLILNSISETKIPEKTPDFRLIDRKYVNILKQFKEQDRLFRGLLNLIMPMTSKVKIIEFVAPNRFSGTTKYCFRKSLNLAFSSIIQFSVKPLRLSIYLGLLTAIFSIGLGFFVVLEHYLLQMPTPGYATIMVALTFFSAVQMILLGVIGEYIGKIHLEVKQRPLYFGDFESGKKDESPR